MNDYKLVILILIMIMITSLSLFAEELAEVDYPLEVVKHYLSVEAYDLALETVETYRDSAMHPDSLIWMGASVHYLKNNIEPAAQDYATVLAISADSMLVQNSADRLTRLVKQMEAKKAIDLLTVTISKVQFDDVYLQLLLTLGELYEENYLYSEANDIYINLLESNFEIDEQHYYLKAATNEVFAKNYEMALEYSMQALAGEDSTETSKALFIRYMSYDALGDSLSAIKPLIELYLDFEDFHQMWEINIGLAELLIYQKRYMEAWFVLEKYYQTATEQRKELIREKISGIKQKILTSESGMTDFELFELDLRALSSGGQN